MPQGTLLNQHIPSPESLAENPILDLRPLSFVGYAFEWLGKTQGVARFWGIACTPRGVFRRLCIACRGLGTGNHRRFFALI